MVALTVLAVLAGMAFRGVDALMRAKDRTQSDTERTLRLDNGISQFDADIAQIVNTQVVDPATFDGATLRLTRRGPDGLQLVLWTLQDHRWQRWTSGPMTHVSELQQAWLRSQQWTAISSNALAVLDEVDTFQVYSYCAGGGWGNFQSSCGATQTADASTTDNGGNSTNVSQTNNGSGTGNGSSEASAASGAASSSTVTSGNGPGNGNGNGGGSLNVNVTNIVTFPTGIRIQLGLKQGTLVREREIPTL